jgi:hypothetical protein
MNEEPPLLACDVQVGVHDYPFVVDDAEDVMSALAYSFIGRPLFLLQELEMRNDDNDDTDHRLSSRRDCGLTTLGYTMDLGPAPFANASLIRSMNSKILSFMAITMHGSLIGTMLSMITRRISYRWGVSLRRIL